MSTSPQTNLAKTMPEEPEAADLHDGKAEFKNVMNDLAERAWAAGIDAVQAILAAVHDVLYGPGDEQEWRVARPLDGTGES